jgi:outer membrane protein OmpA-like peptidoglycan-associated protein
MRKMVVLWVTLVASTFVFSALAQQELKLEDVVNKSRYKDNWFLSIGGNANLLSGEQDKKFHLSDRITYGGQFTVGKWLPSNFGMRLQVNGGQLRGFNYIYHIDPGYYTSKYQHFQYDYAYPMGVFQDHGKTLAIDNARLSDFRGENDLESDHLKHTYNTKYFKHVYSTKAERERELRVRAGDAPAQADGFSQEFNYVTAGIDLMYNLTDLFRGYVKEEGNKFEVIPFAGLGYLQAFDNENTTPDFYQWVVKVGFRLNYNITKKIGVYLELQGNATDPEFDGYKGTAMIDAITNLGLGLQYSFTKNYPNVQKLTLNEINDLNQKVNENRALIENHQDILEKQQDLLDRLQNCCDEKPVVVTTPPPAKGWTPEYVRFALDSYIIQQPEHYKIDDAVEYLKATPGSKIMLIGYADKQTANPAYNLKLSQKRVDAVAAEFRRLGIDQNRVIVEWKGDKEQPFSQNDWNRVVIMVERK